eukprot:6089057-Ditylum_brightwellii.AAC.1
MGRDIWPNLGLDNQVLHIILRNLEEDLLSTYLDRPHKQILLLIGIHDGDTRFATAPKGWQRRKKGNLTCDDTITGGIQGRK